MLRTFSPTATGVRPRARAANLRSLKGKLAAAGAPGPPNKSAIYSQEAADPPSPHCTAPPEPSHNQLAVALWRHTIPRAA